MKPLAPSSLRTPLASALAAMLLAVSGLAAQTSQPAGGVRMLRLCQKQSEVVQLPWAAKRVSVTDPKVADIQVLGPQQVLVQGLTMGATDLVAWNDGEESWRARVTVEYDTDRIQQDLVRLFPQCSLQVAQGRDDFVLLTGQLARAQDAVDVHRYMDASGVKYVDMISLAGVQQVQLRVRVAEVSRSSLRVLGFTAFMGGHDFFGGLQVGSSSGAVNPISIGPLKGASATNGNVPYVFTNDVRVDPLVTVFGGFPKIDLEFFLQALAENQYLRILAEPTLVALSGEEASFLAGGQFPIPVAQGNSTAGTSITVEYKDFGVRLKFRPTVLGDNNIRLFVAPEVSELSDIGAVELQGFRIPSIVTRKAQTTLELHSGQSFAMAGLISRTARGRVSRTPGAGDVPILGALFRSSRYESSETDLVVLVTATLVEPLSSKPLLPGELHSAPNDWEFYGLGKIEGSAVPKVSPSHSRWLQDSKLDQLRGPGAWETYDQRVFGRRGDFAAGPRGPEVPAILGREPGEKGAATK